jgi:hypothetical protein
VSAPLSCVFVNLLQPTCRCASSTPTFPSTFAQTPAASLQADRSGSTTSTKGARWLLERVHKPLADFLRKMCSHASADWADFIPTMTAWRWSAINRSLGMCPYEAFFCRKPQFAYDRLGPSEVCSVTPNELANISACIDVLISTAAVVSSARVAAQYDKERDTPPRYLPSDTVSVYVPNQEQKLLTDCDTAVRSESSLRQTHAATTHVQDTIPFNNYEDYVERIKTFDMARTSLEEQAPASVSGFRHRRQRRHSSHERRALALRFPRAFFLGLPRLTAFPSVPGSRRREDLRRYSQAQH